MKNSFKTILSVFILTFAVSVSTFASDKEIKKVTGFNSGVYASKSGKIKVNVDKYNDASTAILFQDAKGKVFYKEITGKSDKKLRLEIDTNELPAGNYTLEISSKGEKQTREFQLLEKITERSVKMD
ncbi:hypothetical protein SAMN04487995_1395 [Dyadobacter koreensis]|uniref:Por secretion system C-terminal sorting domain-containing protein n=1 Tax=Dyadobacter koreensis TaxID=408657 RepID=A0A1H6RT74_9BACT|nr:hypothetical protein [Dyadobacter koreensis]SEI56664.1 hypothetical protein SAMN04487995_1395 [Dyadobacter koreensis]